MEIPKIDENDATPPYFKSWKPIYWLVVGNIVLIILFLYLLSNLY